jgi:hypothetical protein
MIPLSRVLARFSDPTGSAAEPEAGRAPIAEDKNTTTYNGTPLSSLWNPTGNIFDLRPDLAYIPISELAGALLAMRQLLRSFDENINRQQLMRFERQYSNALWHRVSEENISVVIVEGSSFRLLLTEGMDVILLPA